MLIDQEVRNKAILELNLDQFRSLITEEKATLISKTTIIIPEKKLNGIMVFELLNKKLKNSHKFFFKVSFDEDSKIKNLEEVSTDIFKEILDMYLKQKPLKIEGKEYFTKDGIILSDITFKKKKLFLASEEDPRSHSEDSEGVTISSYLHNKEIDYNPTTDSLLKIALDKLKLKGKDNE